uniref:Focadhesin n=1 Tax=Malurus cyaneus samueli TaxID=2593467 RepID=A0A8C5TYH8_9PASS
SIPTPALNLLWEKCCSENVALRTACCEGLVALVVERHAELDYVLHGALNLIPSARNVHGLVKAICKLIQIQAIQLGKDGDESVWRLYGIRSTPHPLITVLENRPDCWPVLLQQITLFFHQCPEREERSCIGIMASFLRYLYCEPSQLREYAELRMGLLKILLQPHGPKHREAPSLLECEILQLLCDLIPYLQLKDLLQVTEALFFMQELFLSLLRYPVFWKVQLSQLSLQLLCFCEVCLNVTGECSSLISLIEDNFELLKEVFPVEQCIIGLALLLLQSPESQQKSILSLAYKLLSYSETQDISATSLILVMPVLQILSSKTVGDCLSRDVSETTRQQLAVNLLGILKEEGVPNLIPVLIFKLGRPLEPALYRDILYTLPTLGVHKVCVSQILRAIHMLGSTPKLRATASRLMTSLWERQDRIYPELQKFLAMSDMPSVSVDKDAQWEKLIAKAACIRDICRPYQHGADMLAAISQVLNECTKPDQASPAAIVLQGLRALCEAEVVCIRSTWNALSPKLSCDRRPLILKALNELFSLVPSLTVNTKEFEVLLVSFWGFQSLSSDSHTPFSLPSLHLLHQAFEEFATSLVKQEMTNMPRAVYHTALRGGTTRSDQGKTVAGVPNFLLKMYERNKQPGMTPGLAAGMLLCFDLPVHMGKDGKPINRFLASRGRNFQQMLVALIHEVNIQPSEWHHSILLPQSWLGFMSRTYSAVLQGRQAELEMQLKHGKEDPEEVQYKQFTAWLWVRDMLTDVIKGASKDSPVVKGNSIFALTGLAVAVAKYESSLSSDTDGVPETEPDFIPMKHWISMVTETLLSIVNSRYQPKGQVFPWFYQKSYSGENTAKKVSDMPGQQMNFVLMKSLDVLESCCFDTSLEYNTGCILGVGLVLSFMSHSSQTELRVHVSTLLQKLCKYLDSSEDQSRGVQEVLAYSVACSCVSAFSVGIIEAAEAEKAMTKLRTLAENYQQTYSFALALGAIVHGLSACGHGKAEDLSNRLMPAWIKIVLAEVKEFELILWILYLEICLMSDLLSQQIISYSEQIGLQTNAARLLGRLHMSCLSSTQNRASVQCSHFFAELFSQICMNKIPTLTESSVLGPESVPAELVKVALAPIASVGESHQYPPVNWASILSPLMRLDFGDEVKHLCLELAVTQAQSSQNAAMLLGMWVAPPLIYSLSKYLFMSLSLWMQHVAEDKLQSFTEVLLIQQFEVKNLTKSPEICRCVLQGLIQAMKLPNPAQFCWSFLCQAVEKIYELLPNEVQRGELEMYIDVARCISEMADSEIDRIVQISENNIEKATFMKVYLVSQGRLPLMNLSAVIAVVAGYHQKENILWIHENTGVLKRMDWLLDLMGYIRNVAYKSTPLQNVDLKECINFLLWLFAAFVVAWADHGAPLLLGLSADWSLWKHHMVLPELSEEHTGKHSTDKFAVQETLTLLPSSLSLLLAKEPWKEQTEKFIDWLISMMECPTEALSKSSTDLLKVTLLALRSLAEFKKKAVWTKAYGW